jgi:TolB-like protein
MRNHFGQDSAIARHFKAFLQSYAAIESLSFHYKGKPIDAKAIGRELGVRYLLEGSVRRLGEKVEVNAQLISTETGAHVWADRFDGERSKLGELQVEVVSRLAFARRRTRQGGSATFDA